MNGATPDIAQDLQDCLERYETALASGDPALLNDLIQPGEHTIRFGAVDHQIGSGAILAARTVGQPAPGPRNLDMITVTPLTSDLGLISFFYRRAHFRGKIGRETQTWMRTGAGWRLACLHSSVIDDPASGAAPKIEGERRASTRYKTLKSVRIVLPGGMSTIDATVRNRSELGLLIRLNGPVVVPPEFEVLVDQERRPVRVVRRQALDLGVAYL